RIGISLALRQFHRKRAGGFAHKLVELLHEQICGCFAEAEFRDRHSSETPGFSPKDDISMPSDGGHQLVNALTGDGTRADDWRPPFLACIYSKHQHLLKINQCRPRVAAVTFRDDVNIGNLQEARLDCLDFIAEPWWRDYQGGM